MEYCSQRRFSRWLSCTVRCNSVRPHLYYCALLLSALLLGAAPSFCANPARPVDETSSRLAALPQDTITVFIVYYGDSAGQGFVPARILPTFSAIANRPMYSWIDSNLGRGIVGGSLAKIDGIGVALGNLALRVPRGEKPDSIPEQSWDVHQREFDWLQMKRWGIAMDKVPADATVINREYTVWELYKWRIVGLIVLILVEFGLVIALIRSAIVQKRNLQQLAYQQQLKASILDSLSNHIVVVDSKGMVVAVNDPKFEFVAGNSLLGLRVGTNYFEICRSTIGDNPELTMALEGIQSVFDGKRDYFELEFALPSATEPTSLLMSVTPLKGLNRGIVVSHHDITERKRHELAIQDLSGRLINAQEQERSRIARELHDDINQQLAVLAIELQQLQDLFPEDSLQSRQKVQVLWKKTLALSTDLQHLSHQLHSTKLEHLGIITALRGLCGEFSEQHKIGADFQFRQVPPKLDPEISLHLFRVAQESLHNVAKHSRAKKVRMELIGTGGMVVLRVSDDGIGFDPDASKYQTGLGMTSMSERIRFVGGTLSIWSKPSMGTQVEATIILSGRHGTMNRISESVSLKTG
jgi:signal transduction histidine kinase